MANGQDDGGSSKRTPRPGGTLIGMAPVRPEDIQADLDARVAAARAEEGAPADPRAEGAGDAPEPIDEGRPEPRMSDPDLRLDLSDEDRLTLTFTEDEDPLELPSNEESSSDSHPALGAVRVRSSAGSDAAPTPAYDEEEEEEKPVARASYRPPSPGQLMARSSSSKAPAATPESGAAPETAKRANPLLRRRVAMNSEPAPSSSGGGDRPDARPARGLLKKRVATGPKSRIDRPAVRSEGMFPDEGPAKWPEETSGLIRLPAAASEEEGALDLVDRSSPSSPELDLEAEMRERFDLDDFTGALSVAELLLGRDPGHAGAKRIAEQSRRRLENMLTSRLGGTDRTPRVVVAESEMRWLGLDHRGGFLLSRIDGGHVEDILDVCGMPRIEALKTLVELLDAGAITLD